MLHHDESFLRPRYRRHLICVVVVVYCVDWNVHVSYVVSCMVASRHSDVRIERSTLPGLDEAISQNRAQDKVKHDAKATKSAKRKGKVTISPTWHHMT